MYEVLENPESAVCAYLVGLKGPEDARASVEEHLDELRLLTGTMGLAVAGAEIVSLSRPTPDLLIGRGKAEAIAEQCRQQGADCLIFDDDLSPTQQRNWEKLSDLCVIDRREVILDIFAARARTQEARLQVRLAQLEYSLPRLRRAWTHLERQRGGGGFRGGGGEHQLELDQRQARNEIAVIRRRLSEVRRRRDVQRRSRSAKPVPNAAIVGYTNAGKSTLLRALTGAETLVEDKLFATLDPLTRRLRLPGGRDMLVTDTVGFIRKLPHDLVEAFKATLEETRLADFLIHVVDASHPGAADQIAATNAVLREIGAFDKPTILALNKIDRLADAAPVRALAEAAETPCLISAETGEGLDGLLDALARLRLSELEAVVMEVPASRYDVVARIHREGDVLFESYAGESVWLEARLPRRLAGQWRDLRREALPTDLLAAAGAL